MKIGILTTLWKRHNLETAVLSYWKDRILGDEPSYLDEFEFELLAVGSEGEASQFVADDAGWEYIKARNHPLSDKWNKGMAALEGRGLDGVVIMGSDDLLTANYFPLMREMVRRGARCVQIEDLYYYNAEDGSCAYSPRSHPGAGFFIHAEVLDRVKWKPWPSGVNRMLDGRLSSNLHQKAAPTALRSISDTAASGIILADIKTKCNMWAFNEISENTGREVEADGSIIETAFPGFLARLQSVNNR